MHIIVKIILLCFPLFAWSTEETQEQQQGYREQVADRENTDSSIPYESVKNNIVPLEERWSDFLPIWGKDAREQGYILPLPFGVSLGYMNIQQDLKVTGMGIMTANGRVFNLTPLVAVEDVDSNDDNFTLRFDSWIFPFLNVYGILGETQGRAEGLVELPTVCIDFGPVNCGIVNIPAQTLPFIMEYEGITYGAGITVAGGIGDFFGMIDYNETTTDLDISQSDTDAKVTSARIGWNGKIKQWNGSLWLGAMHQDIQQTMELIVPGSDGVILLEQEAEEPLNYVLGGRWNISPHFELLLEVGVGGRQSQMINLSYRM